MAISTKGRRLQSLTEVVEGSGCVPRDAVREKKSKKSWEEGAIIKTNRDRKEKDDEF